MKKNRTIKRQLMFLVVFATALGILCGGIWGSSLESLEYNSLQIKIECYRHEILEGFKIEAFNSALFKYGKYAIFIWFLGFIPIGVIANIVILFTKGLGVGFTTSVLLQMFSVGQAAEFILSYTLQSLILLHAYALLTYMSIDFILKYIRQDKEKHNDIIQSQIVRYTTSYTVFCLPIILACIIEASF